MVKARAPAPRLALNHRFLLPAVALAVAASLARASASPALPQLGPKVSVGALATGGTYIVAPSAGAPVAAIALWYRAPSTGFGSQPIPSLARLAAQTVIASKPLVGDSLGLVIENLGGRLNVSVYSDSVEISALVPATEARTVVKAMTTSFFAPVVSTEGFHTAQQDVEREALFDGYDPAAIVRNAVFAHLFSSAPQHYPPLGTPKAIAGIAESDVRSFATRAFRSQNAILVASGAVDPSLVSAAVSGRPAVAAEAAPEPPAPAALAPSPTPAKDTFVEASGGYGWVGPPIANEREATAMDFIADYLFRDESGAVTQTIADELPDDLVVGQFITLHDPGVMFVAYAGKDVDRVKAQVDAGLQAIQRPLPQGTFAQALAAFRFHLLSDLQTPAEMADNFGWYTVEGSPEYAPGANDERGKYAEAAKSLTPEFVASVAQKYLGASAVTVTLTPEKHS